MLLEKYWNDMESILFKQFSFLDLKVLDKKEHLISNCIKKKIYFFNICLLIVRDTLPLFPRYAIFQSD